MSLDPPCQRQWMPDESIMTFFSPCAADWPRNCLIADSRGSVSRMAAQSPKTAKEGATELQVCCEGRMARSEIPESRINAKTMMNGQKYQRLTLTRMKCA